MASASPAATSDSSTSGSNTSGSSAGSAGQPKKKKKKRRPQEPVPVATGAWVTAFLILGALVFVTFVPFTRGAKEDYSTNTSNWKVGKSAKVKLSLVSVDSERLFCASETTFDKLKCAYRTTKERFPLERGIFDDNKKSMIQPYRTWPDNKLILASGVWATPGTATRTHREPSMGIAVEKLARFVVECDMKFVGELRDFSTKWGPGQSWITEKYAIVGEAQDCTLVPQDND